MKTHWRDVPIPDRMKHLKLDKRGLPIPYIVTRDKAGLPIFTANDDWKVKQCLEHDLCAISGQKLFRGRWFIGGPLSAFHPEGWYIDTPVHFECMRYAMQVCPYLAATKYTGRLDIDHITPERVPGLVAVIDNTMIPERPEMFVAIMAVAQETKTLASGRTYIRPKKGAIRQTEFWRQGVQISEAEGRQFIKEALLSHVSKETAFRQSNKATQLEHNRL